MQDTNNASKSSKGDAKFIQDTRHQNDTQGAYRFYILSNIRIKSADSIQPFNSSKENIHRQNKK